MKQIYHDLFDGISNFPVIDCHEHMLGPAFYKPPNEPIAFLMQGYFSNDLASASFGIPERDLDWLKDEDAATRDKWPLFERLWQATEHTAYARVTKIALQKFFDAQSMTLDTLERIAFQLQGRDTSFYTRTLEEAGVQAVLTDVLGWLPEGRASFLDGRVTFPERWFPLISLPDFHPTSFSISTVDEIGKLAGHSITSLKDFLEAVFEIFQKYQKLGCAAIKDQSAYARALDYDLPTSSQAETQFNRVLLDPHTSLGWPEGKPLNDYLFHQYLRFARELELPVQLHTGHLAGSYNRVDRANAALLAPALELHKDVRFDLFHGNWPYLGDALFLAKNYPNVALDLCWLHMIDPLYAREMLERAVMTVPHTKMHAFGGDYGDLPEFAVAHLELARQNIAAALAHLVETDWMDEAQALQLAAGWLYNNPNRFFKLGLEEFHPSS